MKQENKSIVDACQISCFSGFVAPYVVGTIINHNQTFEAWRTVFLLAAGIYVNFNLFFVLAGSSKVQPWNSYWDRSTTY